MMAALSVAVVIKLYERLNEPKLQTQGMQLHQQLEKHILPLGLFMAGYSIFFVALFQLARLSRGWLGNWV